MSTRLLICEPGHGETKNRQGKSVSSQLGYLPTSQFWKHLRRRECVDIDPALAKPETARVRQKPRLCAPAPGPPPRTAHAPPSRPSPPPPRHPLQVASEGPHHHLHTETCSDGLHLNISPMNPDRDSHPTPQQHGPLYHKIQGLPKSALIYAAVFLNAQLRLWVQEGRVNVGLL